MELETPEIAITSVSTGGGERKGGKNGRKEKLREKEGFRFSYVFIIILILLLFLSIFSHSREDIAVLEGGKDLPLHNWIGPAGAHFSRMAFYSFGVAAYPIIFFLAICALRPLLRYPLNRKGYAGALIAVIAGITILFAMYPERFCHLTEELGVGHHSAPCLALSGGVIGQKLAAPLSSHESGFITSYIGTIGTFIVAIVFLLSGLVFIWIADWQVVFKAYLENRRKRFDADNPLDKFREKRLFDKEQRFQELRKKAEEEARQENQKTTAPSPPPVAKNEENEADEKHFREASPKKEQHRKICRIDDTGYVLPPVTLLDKGKEIQGESEDIIAASRNLLQSTLNSFGVEGMVVGEISGPRVTRYEISLAPGVKVDRVTTLQPNIAMDLQAESIRMLAPIPGKNTIGVEVPNSTVSTIPLRLLMESEAWKRSGAELPIILGKDVSGKSIITDLVRAPHLLIAGATGSGKSVCIHTLILSLLFRFPPSEMRLIMVDPKMVEFNFYRCLPHLITPVVTDFKKVPGALRWGVNEMERRYKMFQKVKARNIITFNSRQIQQELITDEEGDEIPRKIPYLIIIIDELADIMMTESKADVENSIARIAQKGRAAGIHMVIATQTPRVSIITGAIKANMTTRIALQVSSIVDSKVIIDQKGAEKLLGRGDMLFNPPGSSNYERIQGTWVSDREIEKIVAFIADQAEQEFDETVITAEVSAEQEAMESGGGTGSFADYYEPGDDDLVRRAIDVILSDKKCSTSYIQRRLGIGYNKAASIVEGLEKRGLVGPAIGASAKREILVDVESLGGGGRKLEDEENEV